MELNNYRSVTPLKKKRRKITASAALVLCLLCLLAGILCGRAFSSGKQAQEAAEKVAQIEQESEIEAKRLEAEISARDEQIKHLENELAKANRTITEQKLAGEEDVTAEPSEDEEVSAAEDESEPEKVEKSSGGFMRTLLIIILIIVIIVCLLFAASIFLKKNEDEDEEDDEEYEDEYEDEEYEEEYEEDYEDDEEVIEEDEETEE